MRSIRLTAAALLVCTSAAQAAEVALEWQRPTNVSEYKCPASGPCGYRLYLYQPAKGKQLKFIATSGFNNEAWAAVGEIDVLDAQGNPIPKAQWKLVSVSSQETAGEKGQATHAFDGNPKTYWVSQWQGTLRRHPHQIVIDLGAEREVSGFRYTGPDNADTRGRVNGYEFHLDNKLVAKGNFKSTDQAQTAPVVGDTGAGTMVPGGLTATRMPVDVTPGTWFAAMRTVVGDTQSDLSEVYQFQTLQAPAVVRPPAGITLVIIQK